MGFQIITDNRQDLVVSPDRLWLTADRERVVPDLHPDAAFLLVGEGGTMLRKDAERYGLLEPAADDDVSDAPDVGAELDGMTLRDLRSLADVEGVDVTHAKTKAQVRDALEAARAGASSSSDDATEADAPA